MTWKQVATLTVSIVLTGLTGIGVVVLSLQSQQAQVATMQAQVAAMQAQATADRAEVTADRRAWQASAEADRAAFREEMRQLGERQARIEGALSTARAPSP